MDPFLQVPVFSDFRDAIFFLAVYLKNGQIKWQIDGHTKMFAFILFINVLKTAAYKRFNKKKKNQWPSIHMPEGI